MIPSPSCAFGLRAKPFPLNVSASKSTLIAGAAAVLLEALAWWLIMSFGRNGAGGPDPIGVFGLFFHLPGIIVAGWLHLTRPLDSVFVATTGAVQFFLVFWIAVTIWRHRRGQHSA